MKTQFDVLGIGCVAVDEIFYVDAFPEADSKRRARGSERKCGGLTGTALVTIASLGGRCAFGGLLGIDPLSETIEENFCRYGVDLSTAVRDSGARPVHSVIIVGDRTGTRNVFFDDSAPVGIDPDRPDPEVIRSAKVLFVDNVGVKGAVRAARIARESNIPVVADLEEDIAPEFGALFALVDHLVISEEFARHLTGVTDPSEMVRRLWASDRGAVVVTFGKEGAWYSGDGVNVSHQAAFKVSALDTNGCGDVFHGAYALSLAREESLEHRVRFASAAAAIKASASDIPSKEEVTRLLGQAS